MKKLVVCLLAIIVSAGYAAGETIRVERGYDGRAFEYKMEEVKAGADFSLYRITYDSPAPEEGVDPHGLAWYYRPRGIGAAAPRPAVLCLHILGGDGSLTRTLAAYFARSGLPALMVVMPWFGERAAGAGGWKKMSGATLARAFRQTPGDVRRALDILAARPETDPKRIGLEGISMGAIFGAAVTGMDQRIARAALLLGGGNLKAILALPSREATPIREAFAAAPPETGKMIDATIAWIEPLNWAAQLRGRARSGNILMINADKDTIVPPDNSRALARAIGLPPDKHSWIAGADHYGAIAQLPRLLDLLASYFAGGGIQPRTPPESFTRNLCLYLAKICTFPPDCRLGLKIEGKDKDGHPIAGAVDFRRGKGYRFRLLLRLDGLKPPRLRFLLGCDGKALWFGHAGGRMFYGTEATEKAPPLRLPVKALQFRLFLIGILQIAAMNPDALRQLVQIKEKPEANGDSVLDIRDRKGKLQFEVYGDPVTGRVRRLRIASREFSGTATLERCDFASPAPPETFVPPGDKTVRVAADELNRSVNAALEFLCR